MNYLFVLFSAVLLVTIGLLLIYGLSETPLESTSNEVPKSNALSNGSPLSKDSSVQTSSPQQPFPKQDYQVKPFFRSMKTVISARAFKFDLTNERLTLGEEPNMRKWNIDYPLNFTHARLDGDDKKIYKFNRPNSSDSSGFIVDEFDVRKSPQPFNFTFKKIEFGMFF